MAIREKIFVNPFKIKKKEDGSAVKIITHNGKTYEKVVRIK